MCLTVATRIHRDDRPEQLHGSIRVIIVFQSGNSFTQRCNGCVTARVAIPFSSFGSLRRQQYSCAE